MKANLNEILSYRSYTFGSDPEIFARGANGAIIPAYTFLPSKDKPLHGDNQVCVYNDGFQAEMRAYASACIAFVVDSIHYNLKEIWERSNGKLVLDNAPMIPIDTLRKAPEEHVILGCDPSRNVYHMGGKCAGDPRKLRYRFTGLHVHASGWQLPPGEENRVKMFEPYAKAFDNIIGVYFVAAGGHLESKKRREYYGLAGEYRLPPHGLEYRVLSPVGLCHPGITNLVFELSRGILALVDSDAEDMWVADEDETIGVINSGSQKAAREILKRNRILLQYLSSFSRDGKSERDWGKGVYGIGMNGIESVVKDPTDLEKNWRFNEDWHNHCEDASETLGGLIGQ